LRIASLFSTSQATLIIAQDSQSKIRLDHVHQNGLACRRGAHLSSTRPLSNGREHFAAWTRRGREAANPNPETLSPQLARVPGMYVHGLAARTYTFSPQLQRQLRCRLQEVVNLLHDHAHAPSRPPVSVQKVETTPAQLLVECCWWSG